MKKRIITVTLITGLSLATILSTSQPAQASNYRNFLSNYVNNQQTTAENNNSVAQPQAENTGNLVTAPQQNNTLNDFWANRRARTNTPVVNPEPAVNTVSAVKPEPAVNPGVSQREMEMLNRINEERAKVGVAPLKIDLELSKWARIKSQDMKDNNYFAHNSPTYGTPFEMMRNAGIQYKRAAENISASQSAYISHLRLMASTGHRNNILNPNFTHVGIGIVDQNSSGVFVTQLFNQK